jgi:MoaE-MoaD fusion protein
MRIHIFYLGGSKSSTGVREEALELAEGSILADAIHVIGSRHPALKPHVPHVRWACNNRFAELSTLLRDGDEIALVPPVAGGAPRVRISEEPLDPAAVQAWVADAHMGACVLFVGSVRDHNGGEIVQSLRYEAYEPMATAELERVVEACETAHPDTRIAITHRIGQLPVGELSVVIAAASPHRDAAFEACREALERVKADVPIFKEEQRSDGDVWVGWGGG